MQTGIPVAGWFAHSFQHRSNGGRRLTGREPCDSRQVWIAEPAWLVQPSRPSLSRDFMWEVVVRVLAASDQSSNSELALQYVRRLPCRRSIDLTLATVAPKPPAYDLSGTPFAMDLPDLMRQQQESLRIRLNESAAFLRADFRSVATRIATGSPGPTLCKLGHELGADLISLGAVGRSAIARVLLGSVSSHVATHSDASVIVVRPDQDDPVDSQEPRSPPSRVLLAIGNASSDASLWRSIEWLSLPKSTDIRIVHVMEMLPLYELDLLRKASAYWTEIRSDAVKRIDRLLPQLTSQGYQVRSELIEAPHVGQALTNEIEINRCDLAILGAPAGTLAKRILVGSTSRHVLHHAKCSVLIARSTEP